MLTAEIRNFRGAERASLTLDRIALVAGVNGAGKSSILQAIACALAGRVALYDKMTKAELATLVRDGAKDASVTVKSEQGSVFLAYPAGAPGSTGEPPRASVYATGLESILGLDEKSRARVLAEYLKAAPTKDDLAAELRDKEIADAEIDRQWQAVEDRGWDGAHQAAKEDGTKAKGAWERVAGSKYGTAKAAAWTPEGWTPDLAHADPADLDRACVNAKADLERAIASAAVGQAEIERLTAAAAGIDGAEAAVRSAAASLALAEEAETAAVRHLDATPKPVRDTGIPCPHCGRGLMISGVKAGVTEVKKAPAALPDAENKRRTPDFIAADAAVSVAKAACANARRIAGEAEIALAHARAAETALDAAQARGGTPDAVPQARVALATAEARDYAAEKKREADKIHAQISGLIAIVGALADDGVRQQKLVKVLGKANETRLRPLSDAAGWLPVTLTPTLGAAYGGRDYRILSESEQYRVRTVLQIAQAQIDGSCLIILDRADVLDAEGRNGLFGMLDWLDHPALVGMTISRESAAPNLANVGCGRTYWMKDAVAWEVVE